MKHYDALVIGGGPGGYACALQLAKHGKKTALIEKEELGGTCLNRGCIPAKALIACASAVELVRKGAEFGLHVDGVKADYGQAHARSREVIAQLRRGVEAQLQRYGVDVIHGAASFVSGRVVSDGSGGELNAESIVIATGAAPRIPAAFSGVEGLMTSREALALTELSPEMCIVGAGAIGLEFAYIWRAYGAQVTLIEQMDAVLPGADAEIASAARRAIEKSGITLITGVQIASMTREHGKFQLKGEQAAREGVGVSCDAVLLCAGIAPDVEPLMLERASIQRNERGFIAVDQKFETSAPGIYAIGDVNGLLPLAHAANAHAGLVADRILGLDPEGFDPDLIPRCVYSVPEIASVGLTEGQCRQRGMDIKIGRFPFRANGKALAAGEPEGFVKLIADAKTLAVLGAHVIGAHASELIMQCALMMRYEIPLDELKNAVFPHPSLSESIRDAADSVLD